MEPKSQIDTFGAASLTSVSLLLAFNHVVIKVTNLGIQPVFSAGIRSAGAALTLWIVFRILGRRLRVPAQSWNSLLIMAAFFTMQFALLFIALDLTSVSRASVIFYSMPIWMALGAHLFLPGQKLIGIRVLGLLIAMAGVAFAILSRPEASGEGNFVGDIFALFAAMSWAAIGIMARGTKAKDATPEVQLMVQLIISAFGLIALSFFYGPWIRTPDIVTWSGLAFQILIVASFGFLFWLWLLKNYPPAGVASFSFLSPVFGVFLGWLLLGETINGSLIVSLAMVVLGLVFINKHPKT